MEPNVSENRVIINNVSTNQKNADKIINSKTIGVCVLNLNDLEFCMKKKSQ